MLASAGVFESSLHSGLELEVGQSALRLLLGALAHQNKEVGVQEGGREGEGEVGGQEGGREGGGGRWAGR